MLRIIFYEYVMPHPPPLWTTLLHYSIGYFLKQSSYNFELQIENCFHRLDDINKYDSFSFNEPLRKCNIMIVWTLFKYNWNKLLAVVFYTSYLIKYAF